MCSAAMELKSGSGSCAAVIVDSVSQFTARPGVLGFVIGVPYGGPDSLAHQIAAALAVQSSQLLVAQGH